MVFTGGFSSFKLLSFSGSLPCTGGIHVIKLLLVFLPLIYLLLRGCLRQETKRIKKKLFSLPYRAIGWTVWCRCVVTYVVCICVRAHSMMFMQGQNHLKMRFSELSPSLSRAWLQFLKRI